MSRRLRSDIVSSIRYFSTLSHRDEIPAVTEWRRVFLLNVVIECSVSNSLYASVYGLIVATCLRPTLTPETTISIGVIFAVILRIFRRNKPFWISAYYLIKSIVDHCVWKNKYGKLDIIVVLTMYLNILCFLQLLHN